MRVLVVAGAGTSVELGVPGMVGMGEEFVDHANQWKVEPDVVRQLIGESLDVEHLIEALDQICTARVPLLTLGHDTLALDRVDKIRAEVEWFVQHVAERVVASDARLMWGSVLRAAASTDLTIATTNYDRAIELAANAEGVVLDDGFGQFDERETASWSGFNPSGDCPRLIKLHGSTDWYASGQFGEPTKLRHPMPLFGRAALRLADGSELGSALVLPSREKLLTHAPYPRLSQAFLNAADTCDLAVVVGSSLRDPHIRGAVSTIALRAPLFVVNRSGDTYGVKDAIALKGCASTFLVATLPYALAASDPVSVLAKSGSDALGERGCLVALRRALDQDASPDLRCRAVEELDELGLSLSVGLLRQLVADPDPLVARYSLGLIALSLDQATLIQEASMSPHLSEPPFRDDLTLLREMLDLVKS